MLVVAVYYGFADFNLSRIGFQVLGNDVQKSGFADTVFPDDADFLSPDEFVGEVTDQAVGIEIFTDVVQLQYFFPSRWPLMSNSSFFSSVLWEAIALIL